MAWRPNEQFVCGELDNTVPNKVTGWMKFAGMDEKVQFDLAGNFHRDIRGAKIRLRGEGESADPQQAAQYLQGFALVQKGKVGDMTAGLPPCDYGSEPYFEWFGEDNGRVVIELSKDDIELLTKPIPACESDPIDRKEQAENMANFLNDVSAELGIPQQNALAVPNTAVVEQAKKVIANNKIRGMKLLPKEIRDILPPLRAQDGKGGKAVAYLKMFTPSAQWSWHVLEGEPVCDEAGNEQDFEFFGLVFGLEREFGYFMLSELEAIKGPMGLPVERDLYWQPKTLAQIAPDMFADEPREDGA